MIDKVKHSAAKVISFALIAFFLMLGVIGILMPILPGLLFLFLAALIASRHYPALAFCLERNKYTRRAMRYTNSFADLDIRDKFRLGFWATVKVTLEGAQLAFKALGRCIDSLRGGFRR